MAVAGAHVEDRAEPLRLRLGDRARRSRVKAMVEADLDPPPGRLGRFLDPRSTSSTPIPAGFSTRTCAEALKGHAGVLCELSRAALRRSRHRAPCASSSSSERTRRPAEPVGKRSAAPASRSKQPTSLSRPSAAAACCPTSPQPTMPTRSAGRSLRVTCTRRRSSPGTRSRTGAPARRPLPWPAGCRRVGARRRAGSRHRRLRRPCRR